MLAPDIPAFLVRGERARLFPVLADTSKEGRSLSILLACLANVDEFGRGLLETIGHRTGPRTKIEAYTEVCFPADKDDRRSRPDGLLVVTTPGREWKALVEAKIGNADLDAAQLEGYLEIARDNGVDALITISNQFTSAPAHHPVQLSTNARRKIELYHWSWMHVLTEASLLLMNDEVSDRDQRFVLNEMVRFFAHVSAGVKGFDQMPACWTDLVVSVQAGAAPTANTPEVREVVSAWHQATRDLSLTVSRQLGREVLAKLPREHLRDLDARAKADAARLSEERSLGATLVVPGAASPLELCADLRARTLTVSMHLKAPEERKGSKARINWLLRQIPEIASGEIYLRLYWPGRSGHTQKPLSTICQSPDAAAEERSGQVVTSFDVLLVRDLGTRFSQRKNFIAELEVSIPQFYEQVGQHLRAWQAAPPKLASERVEPASVNTEAMREAAEQEADCTVVAPPSEVRTPEPEEATGNQ
jgi:hypothetical protein